MKIIPKILLVLLILLAVIGCAGPGQNPAATQPLAQTGADFRLGEAATQKATTKTEAGINDKARAAITAQQPVQQAAIELAVSNDPNAIAASTTAPVANSAQTVAQASIAAGCPAMHFLDVQPHPANAAYPIPKLSVTCNDETFTVRSNGIPNFEFTQVTPNDLAAQNYVWNIPLNPTPAAQPSDIPLLGPVAVAVNGIPIFGPNEAQPTWGDPYLDQILDYCNGHTAQRGIYHFHARSNCLFENLAGNTALVIGYAFDGYPILAPYICLDAACAQTKEVQSSWQRTQNAAAAWEMHEYIAGSGDLDRCNGMTLADGSYAYFATDTFPYFLGCYHGLANTANDRLGGQGFGGPAGNGQGQAGPPGGQSFGGPAGNNQGQAGPAGNSQGQAGPSGGQGFGGPSGNGQGQAGPPPGGRPNLAAAAAQLGLSEQALREALGPPPPDLAAAAAALGVSQQELVAALGVPARGGPGGNGGAATGN